MDELEVYREDNSSNGSGRKIPRKHVPIKQKGFGLPSDHMTEKQLHNLNGKMKSYRLTEPKRWDEFKSMPLDIQLEYLEYLDLAFGMNMCNLADMFGIADSTLHIYLRKSGIKFKPTQRRMRPDQSRAWRAFVATGEIKISDSTVEDVSNNISDARIQDYPLATPKNWKEFKDMSRDLQEEYLILLHNVFGVTYKHIIKMLGVGYKTLYQYVKRSLTDFNPARCRELTTKELKLWNCFLTNKLSFDEARRINLIPSEVGAVEYKETVANNGFVKHQSESSRINFSKSIPSSKINLSEIVNLSDFSLTFKGKLNIDDIARALKFILGTESEGRIEILCELEKEVL